MGRYSMMENESGHFVNGVISSISEEKCGKPRSMTFGPSLEITETPSVSPGVRWFHTANIIATIFGMGLVTAVTGTTFDDLHIIFGDSVEDITRVLISKSVGSFVAVIICGGLVFYHVNARKVMFLISVAGGIGTAVVPLTPKLWMVHAEMFTTGAATASFECGATVWLVYLWGKNIGPVLQVYNLVYGIGSLITPLITAPFIVHNSTSNNEHVANATPSTRVWIPYLLCGGTYTIIILFMLVGFCLDRTNLRSVMNKEAKARVTKEPINRRFEWPLIGLTVGYILFAVCVEATVGQMIFLYAKRNPHIALTPDEASNLVAVFWGTYTFGRLMATFLSFVMRPYRIVILAQLLLSSGCAVLFLLVVSPSESRWAIWVGTALSGCGVAPLYGSGCSWVFQYFHLSFKQMSLILTAACIAQAVPTYLVAPYLETSSTIFPWVLLGQTIGVVFFTSIMLYWTKGAKRIYTDVDENSNNVNYVDDDNAVDIANDNRRDASV